MSDEDRADATRPRRTPSQARSIERVERIRAAALSLVEEVGVEGATTTAIAERAQVSTATLYQFFANREAILEELVGDQIEVLDRRMADDLALARADSVAAAVAAFLDAHNRHYLEHPEFVVLYYQARYRSPRLRSQLLSHLDRMTTVLETVLVGGGLLPPDLDRRVLQLALELCDRVFEVAYRSSPTGDPAILSEGRTALTRYLEAHR